MERVATMDLPIPPGMKVTAAHTVTDDGTDIYWSEDADTAGHWHNADGQDVDESGKAAMTMTETQIDLSELQDDGDTLTLDDGRVLRLKIEADQYASINDSDSYGKVYDGLPLRRNDMGYYDRPEGFTGNAEKLWYGNDGPWWWEPPTDVKRSDPGFREFRDTVRELLAFGFKGVILELCEGTDYYGNPIVINSASLWGIDSLDNGYLTEVVFRDLADELGVL